MKLFPVFLFIASLSVGLYQGGYAQFTGVIEFDKIKSDTTRYKYFVKDNMVRIEEISKDGETKGIMLIDSDKGIVTALNPGRKLYMDVTNKRSSQQIAPVIEKTGKIKKIKGYECEEWVVQDKEEDTKIIFWAAGKDFQFFKPMLVTLNRKDKMPKYFLKVPENSGYFPMLGIESSMDGTQRTKLEVNKVTSQQLRSALFTVPKGYVKFEN